MGEKFDTYMHAMVWTCTTCGFIHEGGQPKMECQVCESYKTAFINLPQHLEREVRETHPELPPNHRTCRDLRLELMAREGVKAKKRFAGRVLPGASGNSMNPSTEY